MGEVGGQQVLGLPHLLTEMRRDRAPALLPVEQIRKLPGLEIEGLEQSSGEFKAIQERMLEAAAQGTNCGWERYGC